MNTITSDAVIAPEAVGLSSARLQRIDGHMQGYIEQKKLAGAITLIARRGEIAHWECFGHADMEADTPMQRDSLLRIYSMTKPVTAVALVMLLEEGRCQLDDPVARFIPEIAQMKVCADPAAADMRLLEQAQPMTIRHLLTQMSGIPGSAPDGTAVQDLWAAADLNRPDRTLEEMFKTLVELPLAFQPGEGYEYGFSYNVLGYLIQVIADMPLDVFLRTRIFEPLGMPDTGFRVPPAQATRLAAVYEPDPDGGLARVDTVLVKLHEPQYPNLSGGGGLISTAADYLRFAQMLLNGGELDGVRLLGRKTIELMTRNHVPPALQPWVMRRPVIAHLCQGHGYGLGMRVMLDPAQAGVPGSVGEYGWAGAANTFFWIDPAEEMICLFLCQLFPFSQYALDRDFKTLAYQAIVD